MSSDSMNNPLVPGWFTPQQWRELQPHIENLISMPGGVMLIAVTVSPRTQNYPDVAFGTFDADERAALKRALEACKKKRELAAAQRPE